MVDRFHGAVRAGQGAQACALPAPETAEGTAQRTKPCPDLRVPGPARSVAGTAACNAEQLAQLQDRVSWSGYVTSPDFWNRTLPNRRSQFLAVLSMVVLSIHLRQRGSPESKPVVAPHEATGVESSTPPGG
ncbi:DUF6766 family protein [Sphaerisporangium sp. TRM90804]|uniref:DUF6766 family protein n=1 Tax=Sphaerisporangium sp. TRM90804 TaxID=3031113 RepID=UPI00244C8AC7|nr:DUF6766 family protein [Sphaerisporangium sp. TRM90804]MDH2426873.1 hypothetical protein [Sphaerisporangium sp. TRM90804]